MLKLDSHQHFWDIRRFSYPWLSSAMTVLNRDYLPADLAPALAACGISGTVVVQATHDIAETRWLLSLARDTPFIKGSHPCPTSLSPSIAWTTSIAPPMFADM